MTKDSTYLPKDIAKRFGVGLPKVLGWISRGELGAVNVANTTETRPRWRIRDCDLLAFELRRMSRPPEQAITRIRRAPAGDVPRRF